MRQAVFDGVGWRVPASGGTLPLLPMRLSVALRRGRAMRSPIGVLTFSRCGGVEPLRAAGPPTLTAEREKSEGQIGWRTPYYGVRINRSIISPKRWTLTWR